METYIILFNNFVLLCCHSTVHLKRMVIVYLYPLPPGLCSNIFCCGGGYYGVVNTFFPVKVPCVDNNFYKLCFQSFMKNRSAAVLGRGEILDQVI